MSEPMWHHFEISFWLNQLANFQPKSDIKMTICASIVSGYI